MIAIDNLAFLIHTEAAVRIAIVRNTEVSTVFNDSLLQRLHMCRATVLIDVDAIRQRMDDLDLRAERTQHFRHNLIGCTICTVKDNLHAIETLLAGALDKLDVLVQQVRTIFDMTDAVANRTSKIIIVFELMHDDLELILDSIRQFVAVATEELDAVVVERVMGCRDDDTGFGLVAASQISDSWRRNDAGEHRTATSRADTCRKCRLEHLTGKARVAANQDQRLLLGILAEINRSCTAKAIGHLRRQNRICLTADTIRTKQSCHNIISSYFAIRNRYLVSTLNSMHIFV